MQDYFIKFRLYLKDCSPPQNIQDYNLYCIVCTCIDLLTSVGLHVDLQMCSFSPIVSFSDRSSLDNDLLLILLLPYLIFVFFYTHTFLGQKIFHSKQHKFATQITH